MNVSGEAEVEPWGGEQQVRNKLADLHDGYVMLPGHLNLQTGSGKVTIHENVNEAVKNNQGDVCKHSCLHADPKHVENNVVMPMHGVELIQTWRMELIITNA